MNGTYLICHSFLSFFLPPVSRLCPGWIVFPMPYLRDHSIPVLCCDVGKKAAKVPFPNVCLQCALF